MTVPEAVSLLSDSEGPAAQVLNATGRSPVVLVCEHASSYIPAALGTLGLSAEARTSHIAWDPGALNVARALMRALDAPLVTSRVSRLVYDCNRPPEAPDAIPAKSERFEIPGNRTLIEADRSARIREVYEPFQRALAEVLAGRTGPTFLVTVHSFTPVYFGKPREVELGLLHDADARMAEAMMQVSARQGSLHTALNAPYSAADGVTHTLRAHAVPAGLANVMIEIRNDLIDTAPGVDRVARAVLDLLGHAMDDLTASMTDTLQSRRGQAG